MPLTSPAPANYFITLQLRCLFILASERKGDGVHDRRIEYICERETNKSCNEDIPNDHNCFACTFSPIGTIVMFIVCYLNNHDVSLLLLPAGFVTWTCYSFLCLASVRALPQLRLGVPVRHLRAEDSGWPRCREPGRYVRAYSLE